MISYRTRDSHADSANPFEDSTTLNASMIENRTPLSEIQEESSSSTSDISRSKLESRNVGGPASDVSSWPLSKVDNAASEISGLQSDDVYLTELNFASSIEDEIQLRADEALHVIHEYDDGWAPCVRQDRSEQSVCPRKCLSSRPVTRSQIIVFQPSLVTSDVQESVIKSRGTLFASSDAPGIRPPKALRD